MLHLVTLYLLEKYKWKWTHYVFYAPLIDEIKIYNSNANCFNWSFIGSPHEIIADDGWMMMILILLTPSAWISWTNVLLYNRRQLHDIYNAIHKYYHQSNDVIQTEDYQHNSPIKMHERDDHDDKILGGLTQSAGGRDDYAPLRNIHYIIIQVNQNYHVEVYSQFFENF